MGDLFFYIAAFIFVIALIILGAWLWRSMLENGVALPGQALFKGAAEKRIGAIETASIDSRRKLVLIRRDNVEHLIMTGGPVDVVIETGISSSGALPADSNARTQNSRTQMEKNLHNAKRSKPISSFLTNE
ncbi:MAG: hypothetical protein L3J67_04520 [Hyphomicrobiaceae bacterium]|nr:hypothetical protein [Hyphomicrobiaceae bacterium]